MRSKLEAIDTAVAEHAIKRPRMTELFTERAPLLDLAVAAILTAAARNAASGRATINLFATVRRRPCFAAPVLPDWECIHGSCEAKLEAAIRDASEAACPAREGCEEEEEEEDRGTRGSYSFPPLAIA